MLTQPKGTIDAKVIEMNLRRMLYCYGRAQHGGEILDLGDVTIIFSAVPYSVFNIAMLSGSGVDTPSELMQRVEKARRVFQEKGYEWSFWAHDDRLSPKLRRHREGVFADAGLNWVAELPGMWSAGLAPSSRKLPVIESRLVWGAATRSDFTHITATSFQIPYDVATLIYGQDVIWNGPFLGYVGYVDQVAVSTVGYVLDDDVIGVYSVGTLPEYRRRGYAEALMRNTLEDMLARTGHRNVVLQSTRQGHALYRRMGFREATRFSVFTSD